MIIVMEAALSRQLAREIGRRMFRLTSGNSKDNLRSIGNRLPVLKHGIEAPLAYGLEARHVEFMWTVTRDHFYYVTYLIDSTQKVYVEPDGAASAGKTGSTIFEASLRASASVKGAGGP